MEHGLLSVTILQAVQSFMSVISIVPMLRSLCVNKQFTAKAVWGFKAKFKFTDL